MRDNKFTRVALSTSFVNQIQCDRTHFKTNELAVLITQDICTEKKNIAYQPTPGAVSIEALNFDVAAKDSCFWPNRSLYFGTDARF